MKVFNYRVFILFVLIFLTVLLMSFGVFSNINNRDSSKAIEPGVDSLSGENRQIYSYIEGNPYLSYFTGFDTLDNAGITADDMSYIQDYIINYVLYKKGIFNAGISFVKNSYVSTPIKDDGSRSYEFKFGINSSDIHTVKITSNQIEDFIDINITSDTGVSFHKKFNIVYN
jgi:hypothetical protein